MMVHMHWYPEIPLLKTRRLIADGIIVGWVIGWFAVGSFVHAAVSALAAPAVPMRAAGTSLEERMSDAAERVASVPVAGDDLQAPFAGAAAVGTDLNDAATSLEGSVSNLAWSLSLLTAGTPIVLVVVAYILWCRRAARARSALASHRTQAQGQSLLALRALSNQHLSALGKIDPDPVGAWRRGDPEIVAELAGLELARAGLRPGAPVTSPPEP